MTISQKGIYLTTHLKERFIQRTNNKYNHVQNCRIGEMNCEECKKLLNSIRFEVRNNKKEIEKEIRNVILNSKEERSYLNNHKFMNWYYTKYGYDKKFKFLVHEGKDLLFVCAIERGKDIFITCVKAKTHLVGKAVVRRNKFSKKKAPRNF